MATETTQKGSTREYAIDRKTASRLLKVSVRTLDRYIKSGRLSSRVIDGRIWLSKNDLLTFRRGKEERKARRIVDSNELEKSIEIIDEIVDTRMADLSSHSRSTDIIETVYKKLYEEAKGELDEQRKRLEGANYKVGQLEAELRTSMPLIEYQATEKKLLAAKNDMKERLDIAQKTVQSLDEKYKIEKYNKYVYFVILFVLLALQPLWLLFLDK